MYYMKLRFKEDMGLLSYDQTNSETRYTYQYALVQCNRKLDSNQYKSRLAVRRDSQRAGINYGEVLSPVAHNHSNMCCMLLSKITACDFKILLVHVYYTCVNAHFEQEVYMCPAQAVIHTLDDDVC